MCGSSRASTPMATSLGTHQNARGVDLNRNFDPAVATERLPPVAALLRRHRAQSEPESQAIAAFLLKIKPKMTAWYHGPLHVIDRAVKWGVANDAVLGEGAAQVGYSVATVNCSPTGSLRRERLAVRQRLRARILRVRHRVADRRRRRADDPGRRRCARRRSSTRPSVA